MAIFSRLYHLFHSDFSVNPVGVNTHLGDAYSIKWALKLNQPGTITVVLPARGCELNGRAQYTLDDFPIDSFLTLRRTVDGSDTTRVVGPGAFLIDSAEISREDTGRKILTVTGTTALGVLSRRINPYDGDDPRSDIAAGDPVTDVMRDIVRQNFLAAAGSHVADPDPDRDASAALQVQADDGFGAAYDIKIQNQNVLRALQSAARFSAAQNQPVFFEVRIDRTVAPPFIFEIRNLVYGVDRTAAGPGQVVLREELDFLGYKVRRSFDNYVNRVYGGGSVNGTGTGAARTYVNSDDPTLAAQLVNRFALREDFISSSGDTAAKIQSDADSARLQQSRTEQIEASLLTAGRLSYGLDFDFGDLLIANADGLSFTVHVDSEAGEVSDNGEERLVVTVSDSPLVRSQPTSTSEALIDALSRLDDLTASLETLE